MKIYFSIIHQCSLSLNLLIVANERRHSYIIMVMQSLGKTSVNVQSCFLLDKGCSIFSHAGKFSLAYRLKEPTRDTESDVSCLQTSLTHRNEKLLIPFGKFVSGTICLVEIFRSVSETNDRFNFLCPFLLRIAYTISAIFYVKDSALRGREFPVIDCVNACVCS